MEKTSEAIVRIRDREVNEWDEVKGRVQEDWTGQRVEREGQWKRSSRKHLSPGQLRPASRMCARHKAQYEIFTPSAPRHRVYFRWGQATEEACLCESQHSAKHWESAWEGTGWEECDIDPVKRAYGWDKKRRCGRYKYRGEEDGGALLYTVSRLTKAMSDGRQPLQRSHGLQWSSHRPPGACDHQGWQMQS